MVDCLPLKRATSRRWPRRRRRRYYCRRHRSRGGGRDLATRGLGLQRRDELPLQRIELLVCLELGLEFLDCLGTGREGGEGKGGKRKPKRLRSNDN